MDIVNILIYAIIGLIIGAIFSQILKVQGGKLGTGGNLILGLIGALFIGIPYELTFEQRTLELGILYAVLASILVLLGSRLVNKLI